MQSATSVPGNEPSSERVVPLGEWTIASTLQFLIPPSPHGIPSSILSSQLQQRHHFLALTPEEPASYFFLHPGHPSQDTAKVLSTLNQLADQTTIDDLARSVLYSTDGEDVLSHVITMGPGAIQFVFVWQRSDGDSEEHSGWKYLDVKPFSSSAGLFPSLEEAEQARLSTISSLAREPTEPSTAEDSYWSAYDNLPPSSSNNRAHFLNGLLRNQSITGLSQRSASPRREEAYWDRYGYDSDDEDGGDMPSSTIVPPPAQVQGSAIRESLRDPHIPTNQYMQTHVWTSRSPGFNPEDLAEALAMHLQTDLPPSSTVAEGLVVSLNTPPSKEAPLTTAIVPISPLEADHASTLSDPSVGQETSSAPERNTASEEAVLDATRGIYSLWKSTRGSQIGDASEEKQAFLALVSRALADL